MVSTCEGQPCMKRKITRLAFAGKCGGLTASGLGAPGPTVAACACSPSMAASAMPPNPVLLTRSNSRRESRRFKYEFQCAFIAKASIQIDKLIRRDQRLAKTLPGEGMALGRIGFAVLHGLLDFCDEGERSVDLIRGRGSSEGPFIRFANAAGIV